MNAKYMHMYMYIFAYMFSKTSDLHVQQHKNRLYDRQ